MDNILIVGGAVITVDKEERIFDPGEIVIQSDKIYSVGPLGCSPRPPLWEPQRVINAENKIILPGLINAHTHAAMTLFRGLADDLSLQEWLEDKIWPLEAKMTAEDIYWGTLLAIVEMLKAGVTAFADMYFHTEIIAEAVKESGIRASIAPGLIGLSANSQDKLINAADFCQRWSGKADGRITTMLGPHAPYTCPPPYLREVLSAARELGVGIHTHLAETKKEVVDIKKKYGLSPLKYLIENRITDLHMLAAHCVHLGEEDFQLLTESNIAVVHNPTSNLKLASGVAPISQLLAQGALIALGTDGAASNNTLDILKEARLAALLQKSYTGDATRIPANLALQMATTNGAAALGLEGTGKIEAGLKADLVIIDREKPHMYPHFDPVSAIIYSSQSSDVETVLVDGKVVVDKGIITTLDEEKVVSEANRRAKKLKSI
jgi:5-methylthioadenosine/S-adenosylhomocysteine deaminase